jgi:hypothetical protein
VTHPPLGDIQMPLLHEAEMTPLATKPFRQPLAKQVTPLGVL